MRPDIDIIKGRVRGEKAKNEGRKKMENEFKYEKKIEWNLKSGKAVSVIVRLRVREMLDADGYQCPVSCCQLETIASAPGMNSMHYPLSHSPQVVAGEKYPATIGRLAIPAGPLAEIEAAIKEIEKSPEWQKKERHEAAEREADRQYAAHCRMMRRAMSE